MQRRRGLSWLVWPFNWVSNVRGKAGKLSWGLAGLSISSLFPNILGALTQPRDKISSSR